VHRQPARQRRDRQLHTRKVDAFLGLQALAGFLVLIQFNAYTILLGILGAVVAGFFHYMKVGPIEEKEESKDKEAA